MSDLIFFIKTLTLTLALVVVMQIQVGDRSLENHAMRWMHTSAVVAPLNDVARGAAKLIKDATNSVKKKIKNPFRESQKPQGNSV